MVGVFAHSGGVFKPATAIPVNNNGTWQNAQEVWAKDNDVWVKVFPAEVREPATGEYYELLVYAWDHLTNIRRVVIDWAGSIAYDGIPPDGTITMTVGSWTYYRGTQKRTAANRVWYGVYRIGKL